MSSPSGKRTASAEGIRANILFGVGVVGIVSGTYLIVTSQPSSPSQSSALWLGAGVGQVAAGGSF